MSKNQQVYNNIFMGSKNKGIGSDCGRLIAHEILCTDQLKQSKKFQCQPSFRVEEGIRKQVYALEGDDWWFSEYIRHEALWKESERIAYVEFRGIF